MILQSIKKKKELNKANSLYQEYYCNNYEKLIELLEYVRNQYKQIVVWGAGLKGQSFLNQCDKEGTYIDFVIDMDERKQNRSLITGHMVRGIQNLQEQEAIILILNENYYTSICFDLINHGYNIRKMRLVCLDHFIQGRFTLNQIKENTIWERKKYYD